MQKDFFAVSLVFSDGKKQYFVKTYFKPSAEPLGLSEPMGIFSYNSKDARLLKIRGKLNGPPHILRGHMLRGSHQLSA